MMGLNRRNTETAYGWNRQDSEYLLDPESEDPYTWDDEDDADYEDPDPLTNNEIYMTPEGRILFDKESKDEYFSSLPKWREKIERTGSQSYYYLTDEWEEKRTQVIRRDNFQCQGCQSKNDLQVHHLTYERFRRESLSDLVTLCSSCHKKAHSGELPRFAVRSRIPST